MADNSVFGKPISEGEKDENPITEVEAEALKESLMEDTRSGSGLFGKLINEAFMMEIPEYANKARMDRSVVAIQWKDREGFYNAAVNYVRELKKQWGNGVSTLCVLYNGTGEPLKYHTTHNWFGSIYTGYPQVIENGYWAGFFHVKATGAASGSEAAVVYRGKNKQGEDCDWLVAWDNPWNTLQFTNQAYAEINEAGYFDRVDWDAIEKILAAAGQQNRVTWQGCVAEVKTEVDTSPLWEGVLSLE